MATIEVNTNRKEIEIVRDGQNVGSIFFSPSDTSIIARLSEAEKRINGLVFSDEAKNSVEEMVAEMKRCDGVIRDSIDYAFGYPVSEVVFGDSFSYTTDNGVSAVEQFLRGAMDYIEKELGAEVKKAKARQDKYLKKYKGGKR